MFRITGITLTLALLGAAADANQSVPIAPEQPLAVEVAAAAGAPGLTQWRTGFVAGDPVARLRTGADCATDSVSEWSELLTRRVGLELKNAFRSELARESTVALAALQFKAVVDEVQMQVCHVSLGAWQGGFRVRVTWTVQAPGSDRVLYRGATTGAYVSAQAQTRPAAEGLRQAMAAAAHELVADPRLAGVATAHADAMGAGRQLAAADRPGPSLSALE